MTSELKLSNFDVVKSWARLSRLPFHLVGVFPLIVGINFAKTQGFEVGFWLQFLPILAVILVMLSTYLAGEYYDQKEDSLSIDYGKSNFAGGTAVIQDGLVNEKTVLLIAKISAVLVIALGMIIYFGFNTGIWTLPLGAFGLFCGYFYSIPPFRFVKRGFGEILIGVCYGYLPVTIGYYLLSNTFDVNLFFLATPIAISIFSVILINEFPDNRPDTETGKKNIVVRVGLDNAATIYVNAQLVFVITMLILSYLEIISIYWLIAPMIISLTTCAMVYFKLYRNKEKLEMICGMTIVINLATNLMFMIAL